jgi:two-component system, OmpR family, KDP operon response regulator KdpE
MGTRLVTVWTHNILIIEDEPAIRAVLRVMLARQGYNPIEADTGARAQIETRSRKPDLLLMDLGLPDIDGLTVIRSVRAWSPVPIIVLSAHTLEEQKIAALDAGADDFITKPFSEPELLARVRAALRRNARHDDQTLILELGLLTIDLGRRLCVGPQGAIHLTPLEYRVLECLARQTGMVVRQQQILREVWGPYQLDDTRRLRVLMKQLRQKLEPDPHRPRYLITQMGVGYRLFTIDKAQSFRTPERIVQLVQRGRMR